jgi:hypothetical protein
MMQTIIHTIDFHTSSPVVLSRRLGRKKDMDLGALFNGHLAGEKLRKMMISHWIWILGYLIFRTNPTLWLCQTVCY